jgi:hypothetical protein
MEGELGTELFPLLLQMVLFNWNLIKKLALLVEV